MAKKQKSTPGINAGSMADVSFILLFFFLMVSSMDSDFGLLRQLPPYNENQNADNQINERNAFVVLISAKDELSVEGEYTELTRLRQLTKNFFMNPNNSLTLSEKKEEQIPFFGNVLISKGVVSLQNDRGTSYRMYLMVQNELSAAVTELREERAKERFGKPFDELSDEEKDAVSKFHPMAISEAEPVSTGGN